MTLPIQLDGMFVISLRAGSRLTHYTSNTVSHSEFCEKTWFSTPKVNLCTTTTFADHHHLSMPESRS